VQGWWRMFPMWKWMLFVEVQLMCRVWVYWLWFDVNLVDNKGLWQSKEGESMLTGAWSVNEMNDTNDIVKWLDMNERSPGDQI
jgi:hypothetical protein